MSKEKEGYRDELEQIKAKFGEKYVLTLTDVTKYTGKGRRFCQKTYDVSKKGITQAALARALC